MGVIWWDQKKRGSENSQMIVVVAQCGLCVGVSAFLMPQLKHRECWRGSVLLVWTGHLKPCVNFQTHLHCECPRGGWQAKHQADHHVIIIISSIMSIVGIITSSSLTSSIIVIVIVIIISRFHGDGSLRNAELNILNLRRGMVRSGSVLQWEKVLCKDLCNHQTQAAVMDSISC